MKIALIGFKGTLGSAILKFWNETDFLSSDETTRSSDSDEIVPFDLPEFDVSSRRFVLDVLVSLRPDVIINASGINLIDWLENHPNTARTINIYGPANLREAAKRTNALLVQISCGEVFYVKSLNSIPSQSYLKKESDVPQPESVYAKSKLDGERAVSEYERHLIIRTSALFGPSGEVSSGNLIETLLRSFVRTQKIQVIDNQYFSPTYSLDLVRGLRFLIKKNITGRFHLCNQGTASPIEVAHFLVEFCGLKKHEIVPISMDDYGFRAPHSCFTALDCSEYYQLENPYIMPEWKVSLQKYLESRCSFCPSK